MDVTCSRCGTSYDFEEGLVSTTGTTVKCTQCGHLFKIFRAASSTTDGNAASAMGALKWRVRRVDGSTHTLESLSELTRLIAAGQFQREDEISRTGQVWKRLGDIGELAFHFEAPARVRRMSEPPPEPRLRSETATLTEAPAVSDDGERTRRRSGAAELSEPAAEDVDLEAGTQPLVPLTAAQAEDELRAAPAQSNFATIPEVSEGAGDTTPETETIDSDAAREIDRAIERHRRRGRYGFALIALPAIALAGAAYALFAHEARTSSRSYTPAPSPPPPRQTPVPSAPLEPHDADTKRVDAGSPTSASAPAAPTEQPAAANPPGPASKAAPGDESAAAPQPDPIELCRRGEAALERSAVQTAERAFEQALEREPQMPRAQTGLGYVALERSQPQKAVSFFKLAAKAGRAEAFIGLGDAYRRLGRLREALDAYQTYLKRFPSGTRSSIAHRQVDLLEEQLGPNAHP